MNKKCIKVIFLIIVILTSIVFILIYFNNKNINIEKQGISKEQLAEITENDAYITLKEHYSEIDSELQEFQNFKTLIAEAITNKGVETTPKDTIEKFVSNINKLSRALEPLTLKNNDAAYEGDISTNVTHTNNGYNKVYATLSTSENKYGTYSYSLKINGTTVWSGSGFGSRNTPVFDIKDGDVIVASASGSKNGYGYYSVTAALNFYVE